MAGAVAGPAAARAAGAGRAGRSGRHRLRRRLARGLRVLAGPCLAAPQHRGHLGGRGRRPRPVGGARGVPLRRAADLPRRGVPGAGRRAGADLPAAGGRLAPAGLQRVPVRRPAGPAGQRRGHHPGGVPARDRAAADRVPGRRRCGDRVPADPLAPAAARARRRAAGRRGRRPVAGRRPGPPGRPAQRPGPGRVRRRLHRPAGRRGRPARVTERPDAALARDRGRGGPAGQAGSPGCVRPRALGPACPAPPPGSPCGRCCCWPWPPPEPAR